jgi:hypothetical protein
VNHRRSWKPPAPEIGIIADSGQGQGGYSENRYKRFEPGSSERIILTEREDDHFS